MKRDGDAVRDLVLTRDRDYDLTPVVDDVRPDQGPVPAVPEPAAVVAFGIGAPMVVAYRLRRSRVLSPSTSAKT
ncbi:MAG TPA: PEP-CTERM sorting domain-containing protein [Myxococcota bacterium]